MITTVSPDYSKPFTAKYTVEASDLTGGADALAITLTTNTIFTKFVGVVEVETSAGLTKISNLTKVFTSGVLTITDATTEFATGDKITIIGILA